MSALVPSVPPIPQKADMLIGRTVRASTWLDMALAHNWVMGRGANIVPFGSPIASTAVMTASNSYNLSFRLQPRYQALQRVWAVRAIAVTDHAALTITTGSDKGTYAIRDSTRATQAILHTETLASQAEAETTITIGMSSAGDDFILQGVGCWEVPRLSLHATNADDGVEVTQLAPYQPIIADSTATGQSRGAPWLIMEHQASNGSLASSNIGRRVSLFAWCAPHARKGVDVNTFAVSTSGAGVSLFLLDPPLAARPGRSAIATGPAGAPVETDCEVRALVRGDTGVTGTLTIGVTTGGSVSYTVNTADAETAWTWVDMGTISVQGEDPDGTGGLSGSSFATEEITTHTLSQVSGVGSVHCAGLVIYEPS